MNVPFAVQMPNSLQIVEAPLHLASLNVNLVSPILGSIVPLLWRQVMMADASLRCRLSAPVDCTIANEIVETKELIVTCHQSHVLELILLCVCCWCSRRVQLMLSLLQSEHLSKHVLDSPLTFIAA